MKAVKRNGTTPELVVRAAFAAADLNYRLNVASLPGRPDLANKRRRFAVLVHGCFWHRHDGCRKSTMPAHNREWWIAKFDATVQRDQRVERELKALGFEVLVIWECETKNRETMFQRVAHFAESLRKLDASHTVVTS